MLDARRFEEEWSGQGAPMLEALGFAERDHVMGDTLPLDHQTVLTGVFHHPFQLHTVTPLGGLEVGGRRRNGSFELRGSGRVDRDMGDFLYHSAGMAALKGCDKS